METVELGDLNIHAAMTAMVATIMSANPSTAKFAAGISMTDESGETVFGAEAARAILMKSLLAHQNAWAQWLSEPGNLNAAYSMRVALSPEMREELGSTSPILSALREFAMPIVAGAERIIDLRDSAIADARNTSDASTS